MLNGKFNLATMPQKIASIAARKENAYDPKNLFWLFDFDRIEGLTDDEFDDKIQEFVEDVKLTCFLNTGINSDDLVLMRKTVTGAAVIVGDHFDTRSLLKKWPNVTLKRDDLMLIRWKENAKPALAKSVQSPSWSNLSKARLRRAILTSKILKPWKERFKTMLKFLIFRIILKLLFNF